MKEAVLILEETEVSDRSIFNKTLEKHDQPVFGSFQESMHVFIRNGLLPVAKKYDEIRILEIGFGTGLNAILTYRENHILRKRIHYTTVEINPLPLKAMERLNYFQYFGSILQPVFLKMHKSKWFENISFESGYANETLNFNGSFSLYKIHNDVLECSFDDTYDLIYFDVFSPSHQPELWQFELFKKIFDACNKGATFVSHNAKSNVKETLASAGFKVESIQGYTGNMEMLRAVK